MMRDSLRNIQSKKGQTLIEAVVALAIALLLITSVLTLVNRSNARATNARQSTQASKLAQEGMEIVRNIRDVDAEDAVRVGAGGCGSPPKYCKWSDLYTATQNTATAYLQEPSDCGISESWCLVGVQPASEQTVIDIFSRSVEISDDTLPSGDICSDLGLTETQTKRVTVAVTWQSPLGAQERTVISCLTNWQR